MVSLIVPVYKAEKYVKHCIESLQSQIFQDIEIILVDDGSPDRSGEICDTYAAEDYRIRVIHKENGGVSSARNAGIGAARGEYIVFADSDDYAEPDYIESLLSARDAEPDAGHIWCCFQTVTDYAYEEAKPNWVSDKQEVLFSRTEIMTLHDMWLDTGPFCKLYRTDVIKKNHIHFDEGLSLGEDWLFNLNYLDEVPDTSIKVISKPLYNYVQRSSESLDSKYRPDMLEIYRRLNNTCESYLKKWQVPEGQLQKFYNSRYYSFDKVMWNNMKAPGKSRGACIRQNNKLIKSREFQEIYQKTDCYLNPSYRMAYKIGNFRMILLIDSLAAAKHTRNQIGGAETTEKSAIPKIIHFCWFGGNPLDETARKCIISWRTYFPDWQIIEWNEKNFDISQINFMQRAYQDKKWAFVSDVARLIILYEYGGIYFDTDVEVIRSYEDIFQEIQDGFWGFEKSGYVSNGLGFASVPNHEFLKENIGFYKSLCYEDFKDDLSAVACPLISTDLFASKGLERTGEKQEVSGYTIYPSEYFSPVDYLTGKIKKTKNTHSIHWYTASWHSMEENRQHRVQQFLRRMLGIKIGEIVYGICSRMKTRGTRTCLSDGIKRRIRRRENEE